MTQSFLTSQGAQPGFSLEELLALASQRRSSSVEMAAPTEALPQADPPSGPPPPSGQVAAPPAPVLPAALPVAPSGADATVPVVPPPPASTAASSPQPALALEWSPDGGLTAVAGPASPLAGAPVPFRPGARILVQWDPDVSEAARATALQRFAGVRRELIHTAAMKTRGEGMLEVIQLAETAPPDQVLAAYRAMAGVRFAEVDLFVQPQAVSNDPYYESGLLWGMYGSDTPTNSGPGGTSNPFGSQAELAWQRGFTGSRSVAVGILDTGFDYTHPDLAANAWLNPYETVDGLDNDGNGYVDDLRGWDFFYNNNSVFDNNIDDLHGTHVAGTIGAVGGNGIGTTGVAWDVSLISTKFISFSGGFFSGAVQALDYLTDLKWRHGVNIAAVNSSWTGGGYSQALQDAIVRAAKQNILFIAAAGNWTEDNDSLSNHSYPSAYNTTAAAGYDSVVSVAAINAYGELAGYSNYGSRTVDLAAPGSGIFSTIPEEDYDALSGTSMAAPHVTGAVALYAASHPDALAPQIRDALLTSATPTPSLVGKTVTGGRLNVADFLDSEPAPAFSISPAQGMLAEGSAGITPFLFTIRRHGGISTPMTVTWQVSGSGGDPADADDFNEQTLPGGSVHFAAGDTTASFAVNVRGDALEERAETFTVALTSPIDGATQVWGRATSTILNDDGVITAFQPAAITIPSSGTAHPSPSSLAVTTATPIKVAALEVSLHNVRHISPADLDILLVGPSGATSLLMSDVGGSQTIDGLTLTFRADADSPIPATGELRSGRFRPADLESGDSFGGAAPVGPYSADLSVFNGTDPNGLWRLFVHDDKAPGAGAIVGGWSLSITPESVALPMIGLTVSPGAVQEDDAALLAYTFTRTGSTARALTVTFDISGSATPGKDYTGLPAPGPAGSISFAAGSATAVLTLDPTADTQVERDETVALTLAPGSGYTVATPDPVVGTILNDDYHLLEGIGNRRLVTDGEDKLYVQQGTDTPIPLRSNSGDHLVQGTPSGWEALGVETLSGGRNQLIWRIAATDSLVVWSMDRQWSMNALLGNWLLRSPRSMSLETNFLQDFNGDGLIGSTPMFPSAPSLL